MNGTGNEKHSQFRSALNGGQLLALRTGLQWEAMHPGGKSAVQRELTEATQFVGSRAVVQRAVKGHKRANDVAIPPDGGHWSVRRERPQV